jgi:hypothetical protein
MLITEDLVLENDRNHQKHPASIRNAVFGKGINKKLTLSKNKSPQLLQNFATDVTVLIEVQTQPKCFHDAKVYSTQMALLGDQTNLIGV